MNALAATPAWVRMPTPTIEILAMPGSVSSVTSGSCCELERGERLGRTLQLGLGDREGHVGATLAAGVLDDHVDDDPARAEGGEHRGDGARHVGAVGQGDLGFVAIEGDTRDQHRFHVWGLGHDLGSLLEMLARAYVHRAPLYFMANSTERICRTLDPSEASSSISSCADAVELARGRDDAWIRGVDPVDVGEDLALVGGDGRGQGDRRGVRAPAPEGRDVAGLVEALKPGAHHDRPLAEQRVDPLRRRSTRSARWCSCPRS